MTTDQSGAPARTVRSDRTDQKARAARVLAGLRWVLRHRAWSRYHLVRYLRFALFRLRHPEVVCRGLVFLGRGVKVEVRRGYARLELGAFAHLGDHTGLRAHEGTVRIGDKAVLGARVTVNAYLDVVIGDAVLIADDCYVCDFDHVTTDPDRPVKDQGLVTAPVRIGAGSWLGTKVTVTRGTVIGAGCVIGANSVARGHYPDRTVAAGVPAVVVSDRAATWAADADVRTFLAGLDAKERSAYARALADRARSEDDEDERDRPLSP